VSGVLFSVVESPRHPRLDPLYSRLGLAVQSYTSVRKALTALKKGAPDYVVADFIYGYANNYSGVHISNLDVLLTALAKYAPAARVILLCEPGERVQAERLGALFPLHAILSYPCEAAHLEPLLQA